MSVNIYAVGRKNRQMEEKLGDLSLSQEQIRKFDAWQQKNGALFWYEKSRTQILFLTDYFEKHVKDEKVAS